MSYYNNIARVQTHESAVSRTSRASRASHPALQPHLERRNTTGSEVCSSPHPLDGIVEAVPLNQEPKVHEDVWFPLIHADESGGRLDGDIDFDALNNYTDVDYDSEDDVHDPEKTIVRRKYSYISNHSKVNLQTCEIRA